MALISERWNQFWFKPASADNLGLSRVLLFGTMFLFYLLTPILFPSWGWHENFSSWGQVSHLFWHPIWLFAHLHVPPPSVGFLVVVEVVWKLALGLSCIGLFTRLSTAISFLLGLYLFGLPNNFGRTHHLDTVLVFSFLVMAFSRCGDAWSVDRLIRTARHATDSLVERRTLSGEYTWPVRMIWVMMSLVFFAAGFSKIRHSGLQWITSDTMAIFLIQANYHSTDADPLTTWGLNLAQSAWFPHLLAAAAVILETAYPLALFSRTARWFFVPSAALMQLGIAMLLGPNFYQMMLCQLFWVPWDRVANRVAEFRKHRDSKQKDIVLFDGACGMCQRTIATIKSLDLMDRVDFCDVARQWPEVEKRFPGLNQDQCLAEMYVITSGGQMHVGFDAYRALARVLPLGWFLLPVLYLPGISAVGSRVYRAVASGRHRGACPIPGSGFPAETPFSQNLEAKDASLARGAQTPLTSEKKNVS